MTILSCMKIPELMMALRSLPRNFGKEDSKHNILLTQIHNAAVQDDGFADSLDWELSLRFKGGMASLEDVDELLRNPTQTIKWMLEQHGVMDAVKMFYKPKGRRADR